jgi:hypothetical protein
MRLIRWTIVTLFVLSLAFVFIMPGALVWWPPVFIERSQQRAEIAKRIKHKSGWTELRTACEVLASNSPKGLALNRGWGTDEAFYDMMQPEITNRVISVPKIVSELKPREIDLQTRRIAASEDDVELSVQIVRFKIFGSHSTGGHSTPYLGLEVALGPGAKIYRPDFRRNSRRLAPGIYEVY